MTERMWPVDAVGGAPVYSGRGLRQLHSPYLAGATAADPFGGVSGVRPGTSSGTVTATSTTWRCAPHAGVLDIQPAVEAGPYTYAIDEAVTGAVTASDASYSRIDLIYVQLTDQAEGNASAATPPSVVVRYIAGQPRATPVAPTTPARSMRLAEITVPKTGGGAPSVRWVAPYSAGAGGVIAVQDQAMRDALPKTEPLVVWRMDKHRAEAWNGSGWAVIGRHPERDQRLYIDTNGWVSGDLTFGSVTIPADAQAQRVYFDISGFVSPTSQGDAGLEVTTTAGSVSGGSQIRIFTSIGRQFYGYSRRGHVDIPANTAATLSVIGRSSVNTNYQVTADFTTVASGQFA